MIVVSLHNICLLLLLRYVDSEVSTQTQYTSKAASSLLHWPMSTCLTNKCGILPWILNNRTRRRRDLGTSTTENRNNFNIQKACTTEPERRSNTFLWKVSTDPPSFLFGTLHVAYTHVWPQIDPAVKVHFAKADSVYIELDLLDPNTLIQLGKCQLLPQNVQLTELLAPSLIHRLELQLANFKKWVNLWTEPSKRAYTNYLYNTMTAGWKRKRPMWIFLLLNNLAHEDFSSRGVPALDLFLTQEAQRLGKRCGAVEQVSDQCGPLNNVETKQVALALTLTLDRWEAYDRLLNRNWSTSGHPKLKQLVHHLWTSTADEQLSTARQRDHDSVFDESTGQLSRHLARSLYEQWFLKPMNHLIEQYNCGYLDSVILPDQIVQFSSFTKTEANITHRRITELRTKSTNETESTLNLIQPHQLYRNPLSVTTAQKETLAQLEVYLFEELILKRNIKMATQISRRLKLAQASRQSAFFALGAGHFLGYNDTIIYHLRQQGYVITPIMRQASHKSAQLSTLQTGIVTDVKQRKARNRQRQESSPDLPGEDEVPKFRPHHVKFNDAWILIELFNPTASAKRKEHQLKNNVQSAQPANNVGHKLTTFDLTHTNVSISIRNTHKGVSQQWIKTAARKDVASNKNGGSSGFRHKTRLLFNINLLSYFVYISYLDYWT